MRIGIIGAGFIGTYHARGLRHVIERQYFPVQLEGIYDPVIERAEKLRKECGISKVYASCHDLIRSSDVDAVFICAPTKYHLELVRDVAEARKPVFCEKPLGRNYEEALQITDIARRAGIPNQLGLILRFTPPILLLKQLSQDAGLGRPMAFVFRDDQILPLGGTYASHWRGQADISGGGTLLEHSIHDLDLMLWFFGDAKKISGHIEHFSGMKGVEDVASVQINFENGAVGNLTSVWHKISSRLSCRNMELIYENGYLGLEDEFRGPIRSQRGKEPMQTISPEEIIQRVDGLPHSCPAGLYEDIKQHRGLLAYHFLSACLKGELPSPDFAAGLAAHRVVESVYSANGKERDGIKK
jgi:predicted dehydrogenase